MPNFVTVKITEIAFPKIFVSPLKNRIVFGRSDEDFPNYKPDIDLVSCNAISNGISRQHAVLDIQTDGQCVLIDLDSRNGTKVNGVVLQPHHAHPINNGDKVQLGRLEFTVLFED